MSGFDSHLTHDEILEIHQKAMSVGLYNRELLFVGIPRAYISTLQTDSTPSKQLMLDLSAMNQVPSIVGNLIPLERWLRNATYQTTLRPDLQTFFREKADAVGSGEAATWTEASAAIPNELATIEEKIIHIDDKLPIDFLSKAGNVAGSVARLLVPRYDMGQPQTFPFSTQQMVFLGTGWVIGPRHVITNHHVINARDDDEPDAPESDFKLQGRKTRVQFDYDTESSTGDFHEVEAVQAFDKNLDFTVLKLTKDIGRPALKLWNQPISLSDKHYVSVNIVQHPAGAPKQIALRNNLIAKLTDRDLSYFTDTEGGSSGSPVCTDGWYVIALHKASTKALGNFEFQGKNTAWVNIGTRIDKLIDHLKNKHADLWDEIRPET